MNASSGRLENSLDGPVSFSRNRLRADTRTAGQARGEFARWLGSRFMLSQACRSDLTLAVYEALANAAEHAYPAGSEIGSMDLDAEYDTDHDTLRVVVGDHGLWRRSSGGAGSPARGRGIRLISALADDTTIDTTAQGTSVRMTWRHLHLIGA